MTRSVAVQGPGTPTEEEGHQCKRKQGAEDGDPLVVPGSTSAPLVQSDATSGYAGPAGGCERVDVGQGERRAVHVVVEARPLPRVHEPRDALLSGARLARSRCIAPLNGDGAVHWTADLGDSCDHERPSWSSERTSALAMEKFHERLSHCGWHATATLSNHSTLHIVQ